ncbi:MAG TPA: PH domain-containing protein [Thermoanaerobaculia bacterium]|nr:PH domain-containing protein [Thermoanaerobaculia bacterium]
MAVDQHLQTGEEILYRAHPSRIPLVLPLVGAALLVIAGAVLAARALPENRLWFAIGFGLPILLLLALALKRYLKMISREYILTNQRLIQEEGLVGKRSIDSYLGKINNIEHSQTFWGRLLGYGDLRIETANSAESSNFLGIADPLGFKRSVSAAAEAYRTAALRPLPPIAPIAPIEPAPSGVSPSGAERLRQLKGLLDEGLISQTEFEAKRKQLLDEI